MEQINASNELRLRELCRLCGFNGQNGRDILENVSNFGNSIPSFNELSDKIFQCVGIHVKRNDQLPTKICQICVQKINGIVQFRELCAATDTELRILLGLPNEEYAADVEPVFDKEVRDISVENWLLNVVPNVRDADIILSDAETDLSSEIDPFAFYSVPNIVRDNLEEDPQVLVSSLYTTITETEVTPAVRIFPDEKEVSDVDRTEAHGTEKRPQNLAAKTQKSIKRKAVQSQTHFPIKCRSFGKCKDSFESLDAMNYHKSTYHVNGMKKSFCCHLCKKTVVSKYILGHHMISVHTNLTRFHCSFPMCSMVFVHKGHLEMHMNAIHAEGNAFKCTECPKIFYRKILLNNHLRNGHGKVSHHLCHLCGKAFASKQSLQLHLDSVHSSLKPFQCPFAGCSKAYPRRTLLNSHTNAIHTKKNAFKCAKCSFKSYHRRSLAKHMRNSHYDGSSSIART